jgi:NAD(P)H-dependent flavin oxidoreductase YrpB (nitropropane dioxygenase family)
MSRPVPPVRRGGGAAAFAPSARRTAAPPPTSTPTGLPVKFLDNHEIRRIMKNEEILSAVPALRNFDLTTKAECCNEARVQSDQIAANIRKFIGSLPAEDKRRLKAAMKVSSVQLTYLGSSGVYVRDEF